MNDLGEISVQLDTQLKNLGDLDKVTKKLEGLATAVEKTGKAVTTSDKAVQAVAANVNKISKAIASTVAINGDVEKITQARNAASKSQVDAYNKIAYALHRMKTAFDRVNQAAQSYGKVKSTAESVEKLTTGLKNLRSVMDSGSVSTEKLTDYVGKSSKAWVNLRKSIRDTQLELSRKMANPLMQAINPQGMRDSMSVLSNMREQASALRKELVGIKKDAASYKPAGPKGRPGDIVFFDTETVNKQESLGQLGASLYRDGKEIARFNAIVKQTGDTVDEGFMKKYNKLTRALLAGGQPMAKVIADFKEFAGAASLVAHNLNFDKGVIDKAADAIGVERVTNQMADTKRLAEGLRGVGKDRNTLDTLVKEYLGIDNFGKIAHDAAVDADHLGQVYSKLIEEVAKQAGLSIQEAQDKFLGGYYDNNRKTKKGTSEDFDFTGAMKEAEKQGLKLLDQARFKDIETNANTFTSKSSAELKKFKSLLAELESVGSDAGSLQRIARIRDELNSMAKGKFGDGLKDAVTQVDTLGKAMDRIGDGNSATQLSGLRAQYGALADRLKKDVLPLMTQLGDAQTKATSKLKQAKDTIAAAMSSTTQGAAGASAGMSQMSAAIGTLGDRINGMKAWKSGPAIAESLKAARLEYRLATLGIGDMEVATKNYADAVSIARDNIRALLDAQRNTFAQIGGRNKGAAVEFEAIKRANESILAGLERYNRGPGKGGGGAGGGGGGDGSGGSTPPGGIPVPDPRLILDLQNAVKNANIDLARTNNLLKAGGQATDQMVESTRSWATIIDSIGTRATSVWSKYNREVENSSASVDEQNKVLGQYNSVLTQVGSSVGTIGKLEEAVRKMTTPVKELNANGFKFLDDNAVESMRVAGQKAADLKSAISALRVESASYGNDVSKYQAAIDKLGNVMDLTKESAASLRQSFIDSTASLSDAQRNTKSYIAEAEKINSTIARLNATSEAAARTQTLLNSAMARIATGSQKVHGGLSSVGSAVHGLSNALRGMIGVMAGFGLVALATGFTNVGIAMQQMEATLLSSFDTTAKVQQQMAFLKDTANDLGVSYANLSVPYSRLQIAARESGFSFQKTQEIFVSLTKTSVALGSSLEEQRGVIRAVEQMISKGNVQYEELKNQLGDRLPGAVSIFARAWAEASGRIERGGSLSAKVMKDFQKAMENGLVVSREVLPRVAELLNETMGRAAEEMSNKVRAAFGRLRNTFSDTAQELFNSGIENGLIAISEAAQGALREGVIKETLLQLTELFKDMAVYISLNIAPLSKLALTFAEVAAIALSLSGAMFVAQFFNPMVIGVTAVTVGLLNLDLALNKVGLGSEGLTNFLGDLTNRFMLMINVITALFLLFNVGRLQAFAVWIGGLGTMVAVLTLEFRALAASVGIFAAVTKTAAMTGGGLMAALSKNGWGIAIAALTSLVVYMSTFGSKTTETNEKIKGMSDELSALQKEFEDRDIISQESVDSFEDATKLSEALARNVASMEDMQRRANLRLAEQKVFLMETLAVQEKLMQNQSVQDTKKGLLQALNGDQSAVDAVLKARSENPSSALSNPIGNYEYSQKILKIVRESTVAVKDQSAAYNQVRSILGNLTPEAMAFADAVNSVSAANAGLEGTLSLLEGIKKAMQLDADRKTVVDLIQLMADLGEIPVPDAIAAIGKVNDPQNKTPTAGFEAALGRMAEFQARAEAANDNFVDIGQRIDGIVDGIGTKGLSQEAKNIQTLSNAYRDLSDAAVRASEARNILSNKEVRLQNELKSIPVEQATAREEKRQELAEVSRRKQEAAQFEADLAYRQGNIGSAIGEQRAESNFKTRQLNELAAFEEQYTQDYVSALKAQDRAKIESLEMDEKLFKFRADQERKLKSEADEGVKNGIGGSYTSISREADRRMALERERMEAEEDYKNSQYAQLNVGDTMLQQLSELDAARNALLTTSTEQYAASLRQIGMSEEQVILLTHLREQTENLTKANELFMQFGDKQLMQAFELQKIESARPALLEQVARLTGQSAESAEVKAQVEMILAKAARDVNEQYSKRLQLIEELSHNKDFESGMLRGVLKLKEEFEDFATIGENVVTNMFSSWEDSMVEFVTTGKADFSKMIDGFIADITRMYMRKFLFQPLLNVLFPEQATPGATNPWAFPGSAGSNNNRTGGSNSIPNPIKSPLDSLGNEMNSQNQAFLHDYQQSSGVLTQGMTQTADVFSKAGMQAASQLLGISAAIVGMVGGGGGTLQKIIAIGSLVTSLGSLVMEGPPSSGGAVDMGGPDGVVGSWHTGGVVGRPSNSGYRSVSMSVFDSAQRYHNGGLVTGEVPIIAKRGEIVSTPQQWAANKRGSNVTVVINNQSGVQLDSSEQKTTNTPDGTLVEVAVRKVMTEDLANRGPVSRSLESRYQMRRSGGGN